MKTWVLILKDEHARLRFESEPNNAMIFQTPGHANRRRVGVGDMALCTVRGRVFAISEITAVNNWNNLVMGLKPRVVLPNGGFQLAKGSYMPYGAPVTPYNGSLLDIMATLKGQR